MYGNVPFQNNMRPGGSFTCCISEGQGHSPPTALCVCEEQKRAVKVRVAVETVPK